MIARSWNLRPRPGRYDDAIGLIAEGAKLAERHGAHDIRLTQAATAGPTTGLLVLTCEFENLAAYGAYLDDTLTDVEAQSHNHRIREAEAPFIYESTAMLAEIDLAGSLGRRPRRHRPGLRCERAPRSGGLPPVRTRPRRRSQRPAVRGGGVQLDEGVRPGKRRLARRRDGTVGDSADAHRPSGRARVLRAVHRGRPLLTGMNSTPA